MSNVYKRFRKKSQYEMYLSAKKIKHELLEMGKVKDKRYFPSYHHETYFSLLKNTDELIKLLTSIYTLKIDLKDHFVELIEIIDNTIILSETCVQLLQTHYYDMKLYENNSKRKEKIGKRILNITISYINLSDNLRKYKKGIKQKIKKYK